MSVSNNITEKLWNRYKVNYYSEELPDIGCCGG